MKFGIARVVSSDERVPLLLVFLTVHRGDAVLSRGGGVIRGVFPEFCGAILNKGFHPYPDQPRLQNELEKIQAARRLRFPDTQRPQMRST